MAKISEQPALAPEDVDGSETVPVVKGGVMKRIGIGALIAALAQPFVDLAQKWATGTLPGGAGTKSAREHAETAAASAAALGVSTQTTDEVVETDQDANGRWWLQKLRNGAVRVRKLVDSLGRDLIALIDSNTTRIAALEAADAALLAALPVLQRLRLKKSLYYASPTGRPIFAVDPVISSPIVLGGAGDRASQLAGRIAIARDDPRIRFLGGPWAPGTGLIGSQAMYMQACTNGDPTDIGTNGLPNSRYSNLGAIEFQLPAGDNQFELVFLGNGNNGTFMIDIDGVGTNTNGYDTAAPNNTAHLYYWLITLPVSAAARVIRIYMPGGRPFAGLSVAAGKTIGAKPVPRVASTLAVLGDSIAAGSVATTILKCWAAMVAWFLGIDNYINLGRGGSGWLARYPFNYVTVSTEAGSNSVTVVATSGSATTHRSQPVTLSGSVTAHAFLTGPNIPKDTKVVTGATAGGTALLSAPATATGTVVVRNETGYNFLDRIARDVLQCNNGGPPDKLIISGGINDSSVTDTSGFWSPAEVGAQALEVLKLARAGAPDMAISVTGPWSDWNNPTYPATSIATRDAIFAAAAQVSRVSTIDVSTALTPANKDTVFGADKVHPLDGGHAIYANTIAPQEIAIINNF